MNVELFLSMLAAAVVYHIARPGLDRLSNSLWGGNGAARHKEAARGPGASVRSSAN